VQVFLREKFQTCAWIFTPHRRWGAEMREALEEFEDVGRRWGCSGRRYSAWLFTPPL